MDGMAILHEYSNFFDWYFKISVVPILFLIFLRIFYIIVRKCTDDNYIYEVTENIVSLWIGTFIAFLIMGTLICSLLTETYYDVTFDNSVTMEEVRKTNYEILKQDGFIYTIKYNSDYEYTINKEIKNEETIE